MTTNNTGHYYIYITRIFLKKRQAFQLFSSVHLASLSLSQQRSTKVRHIPETKLPFSTPTFQLTSNCVFTQIFFNLTSSVYFNCPVHNGLLKLCQNFSLVLQFLRPANWHSRSPANSSLSCIQERLAERFFSNEFRTLNVTDC